jgi:hypothetical protein
MSQKTAAVCSRSELAHAWHTSGILYPRCMAIVSLLQSQDANSDILHRSFLYGIPWLGLILPDSFVIKWHGF